MPWIRTETGSLFNLNQAVTIAWQESPRFQGDTSAVVAYLPNRGGDAMRPATVRLCSAFSEADAQVWLDALTTWLVAGGKGVFDAILAQPVAEEDVS